MPRDSSDRSKQAHVLQVATAEAPLTAPFRFALAGEGLCCGYDDGTPVAEVYESPFAFTGTIHEAVIDVSGTPVPAA